MGKRQAILANKLKQAPEEINNHKDLFWSELNLRIKDGQVIPILSNSVRLEAIFNTGAEAGEEEPELDNPEAEPELTIEELLAEIWADEIGYPLPLKHHLARVAQYNRVKSLDDYQAKTRYLTFLKKKLLKLAEDEQPDLVAELLDELDKFSFAHIATELGYPRFSTPEEDPLRLLAKLDLPVYATTSYFDFLERALIAENKHPRTQVCFWTGQPLGREENGPILVEPADDLATDFDPTPQTPLVYHLYGLEKYPESLVLSEDDYLDFLTRVAHDFDQYRRIIPAYLREVLTKSSLLLLGYRLQDWDFRILFRGIINATPYNPGLRKFSITIQADPRQQKGVKVQELQSYLEGYFEPAQFKVKWGTNQQFVRQMWQEWNRWR